MIHLFWITFLINKASFIKQKGDPKEKVDHFAFDHFRIKNLQCFFLHIHLLQFL